MKTELSFILLFLFATVCFAKEPREFPELKTVFNKFEVDGSIVIYDQSNNQYVGYNPQRWNEGFIPASTFKVVNTLIALETGVATPEQVFNWNGEQHRMQAWNQDLSIKQAFQVSAVPVYQEIARRIGVERMEYYLRLFNYGGMDVHPDNIDQFWLEGESKITSLQQIYFLQKLYSQQLPVSEDAMQQTKQILVYEENENYVLSGKTGWGTSQGKDIGWFVGYIETNGSVYFFATNVEPKDPAILSDFTQARIFITKEIFTKLNFIQSVNS